MIPLLSTLRIRLLAVSAIRRFPAASKMIPLGLASSACGRRPLVAPETLGAGADDRTDGPGAVDLPDPVVGRVGDHEPPGRRDRQAVRTGELGLERRPAVTGEAPGARIVVICFHDRLGGPRHRSDRSVKVDDADHLVEGVGDIEAAVGVERGHPRLVEAGVGRPAAVTVESQLPGSGEPRHATDEVVGAGNARTAERHTDGGQDDEEGDDDPSTADGPQQRPHSKALSVVASEGGGLSVNGDFAGAPRRTS